jgi:hypothetical protein
MCCFDQGVTLEILEMREALLKNTSQILQPVNLQHQACRALSVFATHLMQFCRSLLDHNLGVSFHVNLGADCH